MARIHSRLATVEVRRNTGVKPGQQEFVVRILSGNGAETFRTSETYKVKASAHRAIAAHFKSFGFTDVLIDGAGSSTIVADFDGSGPFLVANYRYVVIA